MAAAWTNKLSGLGERLFHHGDHWPDRKIIHDSVWGTQVLRGWEVAIMDLPLLQRLRGIHQTSLAFLTFPTALHTRFDHSLGVCAGTKRLASQVLALKSGDERYDELAAAALLHDIGHGPFSHLSEETYAARPELFAGLTYKDGRDEADYPNGSPHEVIGALLLRTQPARRFFEKLNDHYGKHLDPERIGNIIAGNGIPGSFEYSTLVNGPFDADKIDYLRRDSAFSGVPIALDIDRLVHSLQVCPDSTSDKKMVAIKMQGVVSAEQILFGKATLYSTVFHHHKVRAAECLFKAIIERMFERRVGIDGRPFEDPVDMLRHVDSDFTKWIARSPDPAMNLDERTRRLLDLLARRDLPVRVLRIRGRSLEGPNLQEIFRYRDPSPSEAGTVHAELLELRKEIADKVRERTGDPSVYEDEIWIDLPRTPKEGDGTLIDESGSLVKLSSVYPTHQWVKYYKLHRYVGYVLGPRRHKEEVRKATVQVLGNRRINIS